MKFRKVISRQANEIDLPFVRREATRQQKKKKKEHIAFSVFFCVLLFGFGAVAESSCLSHVLDAISINAETFLLR